MARTRPPQPAPSVPAGFLASAVRLPTSSRNMAGRVEGWQGEAWQYWDSVGELRYVATWIGNVMSRAQLVAARKVGNSLNPQNRGPAAEAMEALYGGPQGQSEMLQQIGVHLTIAGESYITNRARDDVWNVLAAGKVTELQKGRLRAHFGLEGGSTDLDPGDLVIRLWTPHPKDPTKADSPVRSNLATLAQIAAYDSHISAQVQSRLAGAGILFISNEVSFPTPPGADPAATPADAFMSLLGESMLTPIRDRADPSALVPIVAMVPTESLGKNEHIKFWTELDANVVAMRDAAIKRLALGIDVPPEVLLGVADANHWNAWLSEESAVKAHLEPRLAIVAYAMTEQYLRPALQDEVADPDEYFVIADTSSIRLRPNRSNEAIQLYDRGELSGPALRRETGFQPEDAPAAEEFKRWLLRKIGTASTDPTQTEAALRLLGVDLGSAPTGPGQEPPDHLRTDTQGPLRRLPRALPSRDAAENRAGRNPAVTRPPLPAASAAPDGLIAACDVLVYRALERAGNRLKNLHPRYDTSQTAAVAVYRTLSGDSDKLLDGAWDCAAEVLAPYAEDVDDVVGTLDFYVRGLLASHRPHSEVVLRALIDSRPKELVP
jgi:hypothetical protein